VIYLKFVKKLIFFEEIIKNIEDLRNNYESKIEQLKIRYHIGIYILISN